MSDMTIFKISITDPVMGLMTSWRATLEEAQTVETAFNDGLEVLETKAVIEQITIVDVQTDLLLWLNSTHSDGVGVNAVVTQVSGSTSNLGSIAITPGLWQLYRGANIVTTTPTFAGCVEAAKALAVQLATAANAKSFVGTYYCRQTNKVVVSYTSATPSPAPATPAPAPSPAPSPAPAPAPAPSPAPSPAPAPAPAPSPAPAPAPAPSPAPAAAAPSPVPAAAAPSPVVMPAWRTSATARVWKELPGTAMSLCPPTVNPGGVIGPAAKVIAWCGKTIDTRNSTLYSLWEGGHMDYWGNEVMGCALEVAYPGWVELLASSPLSAVTDNADFYSDGRACSSHTYGSQLVIEKINKAMRFGVQATARSGFSHLTVDAYDIATKKEDRTYPPLLAVSPGHIIIKDSRDESVYHFSANYAVNKWVVGTNVWTPVNVGWPSIDPSESAAAWDTKRNRVFLLREAYAHHVWDPTTGLYAELTLSGETVALFAEPKALGIGYHDATDAFYVKSATGNVVYKIDAGTLIVTKLTVTGGENMPAAVNGIYTKFLLVPRLECFVYMPGAYDSNIWVLPLA